MRLIPRSIHGRLLGLSLIATLVALAVAGVVIAGVLERFVTQGLDQRLDAQLALLATAVDDRGGVDRARLARVSGLIEDGPGWQWRIAGPAGTVGPADIPATVPPLPRPGPPAPPIGPDSRPHPGEGRDARGGRLHFRQATLTTANGSVTLTAAAPREIVSRPITAAIVPLLTTLAILGLALGGAAIVQLRLGLRPLRRLRGQIAAIRTGAADALPADQPDELLPLTAELNALIRDNAMTLAAARASAANLAHALKTPIATLALDVRDDPARSAQVDRIYRTVRHHLARARGVANTRATTPVQPVIDDLVATIGQIHAERRIAIDAQVFSNPTVAMDAADLAELLGNLLDNAARHATKRVVLTALIDGRQVVMGIEDDGPGISPADRDRAMRPGIRLDERGDGDGFGLSIAREIAELHGGTLSLDAGDRGGLAVSVTLPAGATIDPIQKP